jgi:hypothetical protein
MINSVKSILMVANNHVNSAPTIIEVFIAMLQCAEQNSTSYHCVKNQTADHQQRRKTSEVNA